MLPVFIYLILIQICDFVVMKAIWLEHGYIEYLTSLTQVGGWLVWDAYTIYHVEVKVFLL